MVLEQLDVDFHVQKMNFNLQLALDKKSNTELVIDFNVKPETIKYLEENWRKCDLNLGRDFYREDTKSQSHDRKRKSDKMDFIKKEEKKKYFFSIGNMVKKMKRQTTDWEKVSAKH